MATAEVLPKRSEVATEYTWNLESIYPTDAEWEADFARLAGSLPEVQSFQSKLGESGSSLLAAFTARDNAYELLGKLYVYAHMRLDEDTANGTYQALNDRVTTLYNQLNTASAYFTPEILSIPQERIEEFLSSTPGLDLYRHVLAEINRQRAHVLAAEMEGLLAQANELGNAPERAFEMLNYADLKLPQITDENGEKAQLTQGNYVAKFLESRNGEVRREAFTAMLGTYQSFANTFGATLSGQVKRDIFFARARKYNSALEAALDANNIPVAVYDNLVETVAANLPKLHRYLELRKKLLGLADLHMYDLYVPMVGEVDYKVEYAAAQETVVTALQPLGQRYMDILRDGYASRWIDVYENQGKRSGAYSSGAYGTQPFILLNYQPTMDSMFTLAHELGHSMHSYFTRQTQPFPYGDYTIFVAEVASTLNEALMTHHLLKTTEDRGLRMYILNHALETYRGTLFRQTMFAEFEREIHARAEAGEALTHETLSVMYKALNDKYYGAVVRVDDDISIEWARIPHFYYNFYVFQYATGISASAALAKQIVTEGDPAVQRYLHFLSRGSSDYSINLLRDAGVDLSTPEPIQQALDTFADYLGQLEQLV